MNSDAEYPLEYSKEKYVMLRRSVFDAMQTRIDDLEVKLAAIADPKLVEKMDVWWHMENKELPALFAIIDELEAELATVKESLTTDNATVGKLPKAADGVPLEIAKDIVSRQVWAWRYEHANDGGDRKGNRDGLNDFIPIELIDSLINHVFAALAAKGGE